MGPLRIDRLYPHAQHIEEDSNSFIKTLKCINSFGGMHIPQANIKLTENIKNITDKYIKMSLSQFLDDLKNGKTKMYNPEDKKLIIQLNKFNLPIIVKTHHKDKKSLLDFVHSLD